MVFPALLSKPPIIEAAKHPCSWDQANMHEKVIRYLLFDLDIRHMHLYFAAGTSALMYGSTCGARDV